MTCGACPEQYDVELDNKKVAYLRLRHGCFRVHVPDFGGKIVYESYPKGDGLFEEDEREKELNNALEAIKKYYETSPNS